MESYTLRRKTYIDMSKDLDMRFLRLRHPTLDLDDHVVLRYLSNMYVLTHDGFPLFAVV